MDILDGAVARKHNKVTKLGGYLDTIFDRINEFLILFGFLFIEMPHVVFDFKIWAFLVLFGSLMTTYSKAAAMEKLGKTISFCLLERGERVILFLLSVLLLNVNPIFSVYVFILLAFLTNLSAFQRILYAINKV